MATMQDIFAGYSARRRAFQASNSRYANGIAWVEGSIVPYREARIPIRDQGFLRSDLTYDVPAIWDGRFFRLADHLDRLEAGCRKLRMALPKPKSEITQILIDMAAQSGLRDGYVELIVTRGLQSFREAKPEDMTSVLYLFIIPYVWVMVPEIQRVGGSAVIARTVRRTPPGAMDPTVKNLQWGDMIRGMFEAKDRGAMNPFLTDGDGHLTEGSGFNICCIKDGVIYTPDRGVLEGVTRKSVFDVAKKQSIEVRCEVVPVDLVYQSQEIFMCTTAGGIMPITTLDGQKVGDGQIGGVTKTIWDGYWAMHYDDRYSFAITYGSGKAKL